MKYRRQLSRKILHYKRNASSIFRTLENRAVRVCRGRLKETGPKRRFGRDVHPILLLPRLPNRRQCFYYAPQWPHSISITHASSLSLLCWFNTIPFITLAWRYYSLPPMRNWISTIHRKPRLRHGGFAVYAVCNSRNESKTAFH
jgi:hypothetical protein